MGRLWRRPPGRRSRTTQATPANDQQFAAAFVSGGGDPTDLFSLTQALQHYLMPEYMFWFDRVTLLEKFNGQTFFDVVDWRRRPPRILTDLKFEVQTAPTPEAPSGGTSLVAFYQRAEFALSDEQLNLLNQSYEALRESVYAALILQTLHKGNGQAANEIVWERAA